MQIPFELYNKTGKPMPATINAGQNIDVFKSNLLKKQLYVSSLTFGDELIPKFVPEYIYGDVNTYRTEIYNYICSLDPYGSFHNATGNWGQNIPLVNATPYYVLCSFEQEAGSINYWLFLIEHAPSAQKTAPYNYPSSVNDYYENDYYHYADFTRFIQQIQTAMAYIVDRMAIALLATYTGQPFYITISNDTINFYVNEQIYNTTTGLTPPSPANCKLYMSNNLISLLNINGIPVPGVDLFSEIPFNINNGDFMVHEVPIDISKICPVKQILLDSNLPVENVQFYSSNNSPNTIEIRKTILMLYYTPSTIFQASNLASYVAAMPLPYIYFVTNENHSGSYPEFKLMLRLNNGIVIPHILEFNGYINLTFRLEIKN